MKTREDLTASRALREQIRARLGGTLPESILYHDRSVRAIDFWAAGSYEAASHGTYKGDDARLRDIFSISGKNCRNGALSRFSQNVGRQLLLFYSTEFDIVIDPFAGHNSRMELTWRSNRHYFGSDVSEAFMEANYAIRDLLLHERDTDMFSEDFAAEIILRSCDARLLPWDDRFGDFTITSPPYYDLEYYGDEPAQLGKAQTYGDFLRELQLCTQENFRVLKPGAFAVWCVNDFRRSGTFHSFHIDTIYAMTAAGFVHHDTAIIDLGPPIAAAFAERTDTKKWLPKRHEYALIFRKPQL
jgi:DNA modification methylase